MDEISGKTVCLGGIFADGISLSSCGGRFWAWLIDVLLMGLLWHRIAIVLEINALSLNGILMLSSLLFVYWTALEGYRGQSLGKMVLNIVVTGPIGESIGFKDAAIEAFGKSFLLPFDCLVCWFCLQEKRQRLFNRLSDTIVINRIE